MNVTFRPISTWPGERRTPARQIASRFGVGWQRTLDDLTHELRAIRARDVVIEIDLDESQIRRDGWPRSGARPRSAGVILSFDSKHGALRYPCDTYNHWQCNLRAIAKSLEALRAVDRYGVTRHAEQYRGWRALPGGDAGSGASRSNGDMNVAEAADWMATMLEHYAGWQLGAKRLLESGEAVQRGFRALAKVLHPDQGGDASLFAMLTRVRSVLDRHVRSAGH